MITFFKKIPKLFENPKPCMTVSMLNDHTGFNWEDKNGQFVTYHDLHQIFGASSSPYWKDENNFVKVKPELIDSIQKNYSIDPNHYYWFQELAIMTFFHPDFYIESAMKIQPSSNEGNSRSTYNKDTGGFIFQKNTIGHLKILKSSVVSVVTLEKQKKYFQNHGWEEYGFIFYEKNDYLPASFCSPRIVKAPKSELNEPSSKRTDLELIAPETTASINDKVDDDYTEATKAYIKNIQSRPFTNCAILENISLSDDEKTALEEYSDPITFELINTPVTLNENLYDLNTLLKALSLDSRDPLTTYKFSKRDIQSARKSDASLQEIIKQILDRHQKDETITLMNNSKTLGP